MLLRNRVIVVTGGANGLGRTYCENLVQEGALVVIADRDIDSARAVAARLNEREPQPRVLAVEVDVTSEAQTAAMAECALKSFGRVDVLLNNAGVYPHVEFDDITLDEWRRVMTINLDSIFLCSKAVLPSMRQRGEGKIINVATNLVWTGLAGMVHYIASKAGVVGFTRALAREVGPNGITVNALAPGAIFPDGPVDKVSQQRMDTIMSYQAVRQRPVASNLIGALIFLCSPDSNFMSGQVLTVDGGLTNH